MCTIVQVLPKRTNVPGMKQHFPRRFNPYVGYRFRRPYPPPYFYSPYGYGYVTVSRSLDVLNGFPETGFRSFEDEINNTFFGYPLQ